MRVVLQRVSRASVSVDGAVVGSIGRGLVLLVGFARADAPDATAWMADKILGLRIFADDRGRMNRSVVDVGGSLLVVSQFTLYGDVRRGRRPSFVEAAAPDEAEPRYHELLEAFRSRGADVHAGRFGAMMDVSLVNDGPVTLVLER